MRGTRLRSSRISLAAACAVVVLASFPSAPAATRSASFGAGSLDGSGSATMRLENLPARVGRFAAVPGSKEVWGIGFSSGLPGGDTESQSGQVVFLKRGADRWALAGAPVDAAGRIINPTLFALSFAGSGEGWAVGEGGVLLKRTPGRDRWVQVDGATSSQLNAVSLAPTGGPAGFAVGVDSTIVRLAGGRWTVDDPGADMIADGLPDLTAVSTVSADEAWAISGSTSQDLRIYRRTSSGWRRVSTGNRMFDGPHPAESPNAGTVSAAFGASVAATRDGAWVGGSMFPSNVARPFGDDLPGDRSRPFVLEISNAGTTRSYCPDDYAIRRNAAGASVDRTALCDAPFPLAAFDVTSLTVFERSKEVFATGLGLFRFRNGGWFREPDANGYLISMAMISPKEGWAATTGNTYGAGGAVHSDESVAGHWTADPQPPSVARWRQPQFQPLEAVAVRPDGSGRAVAVGVEGAVLSYEPGAGWDTDTRVAPASLHGAAWSDRDEAWAVGAEGTITRYQGGAWGLHGASGELTTKGLFGVAFARDGRGYAVGEGGTILRFDGGSWSVDSSSGKATKEWLYAVTSTRNGFVAVGEAGIVLENDGSGWEVARDVPALVTRPGLGAATFYGVAALADGTVYAGGAYGALVKRSPGKRFVRAPETLEGTILSLAAEGRRILAAVSPDAGKYREDHIVATRGGLMLHDGTGWRDLHLDRRRTIYAGADSSLFTDPPLGIGFEPGGTSGWAVGGIPEQTPDVEGHVRSVPTSSIYRIDVQGNPAQEEVAADVKLPADGFTFATFSESWCERGLCSATVGSGTQADLVSMQIRKEVTRAASLDGGPRFVMLAGNVRGAGLPEELYEMTSYLEGFPVPVFGAIGDRDLFKGFDNGTVSSAVRTANASSVLGNQGDNQYWKEIFSRMPAPWGEGAGAGRKPPAGFVVPPIPGNADPVPGLARTHYVFDYQPQGSKLARMIVIDSSTRSYGQPTDQNPQEAQNNWLDRVLTDAKGVGTGDPVPTIIVMNQPTVLPDRNHLPNWQGGDKVTFESAVVANGVSAIFTGGMRINTASGLPNPDAQVVPMFVAGGGGAPLGFDSPIPNVNATKVPSDGFYHAWNLVHVGKARANAAGIVQAPVTVTPFPILESLAIHAIDGRKVSGGQTLRFSALARGLAGGFSDPDQAKTTYFELGNGGLLPCEGHGPGGTVCASRDALNPPFRFYSENPDIADFVVPEVGASPRDPQLINGKLTRDPTGKFGLLCTFKAGTAHINVVSGFQRARIALKVGSGFGPCVPKPVVEPPEEVVPQPERPVERVPVPKEAGRFFSRLDSAGAAVFPPIPAPVVAPAPPGAPGVGRKEEHEQSWETEGHGEDSKGTKYSFVSRRESAAVPRTWPVLGGVVLMSFMGACIAAAARERRLQYGVARARRDE